MKTDIKLLGLIAAAGFVMSTLIEHPAMANVVHTTPYANALNVHPATQISAIFDAPMNPETINTDSFSVTGSVYGRYQGTISYDPETFTATFSPDVATVQPDGKFDSGEIVSVTLSTAIEYADGSPLDPGYVWQFTIAVSNQGPGTYVAAGDYLVGDYPTDVVTVDFDGDNDIDIACANYSDAYLSLMFNDGRGAFLPQPDLVTASQPISLCAADFDSDGDIDLAAPSATGPTVSIHLNNGDGTFAERTDFATCGNQARGSVAADFDADGDMDLAIGSMSGCLALLFNDGHASFSTIESYSTGGDAHDLFAADFDNDGDLDIVASDKYRGLAVVCFNDGHGGFGRREEYPTGSICLRVTSADLDDDGDADFVSGGSTSAFVYWNQGDGSFLLGDTIDVGVNPYSLTPGDLDGDGDMDVLAGVGGAVDCLRNYGYQDLRYNLLYSDCNYVDQSAVADIDNDGDLDLVVTDHGADSIRILECKVLHGRCDAMIVEHKASRR